MFLDLWSLRLILELTHVATHSPHKSFFLVVDGLSIEPVYHGEGVLIIILRIKLLHEKILVSRHFRVIRVREVLKVFRIFFCSIIGYRFLSQFEEAGGLQLPMYHEYWSVHKYIRRTEPFRVVNDHILLLHVLFESDRVALLLDQWMCLKV